jgi:hypothetical protein
MLTVSYSSTEEEELRRHIIDTHRPRLSLPGQPPLPQGPRPGGYEHYEESNQGVSDCSPYDYTVPAYLSGACMLTKQGRKALYASAPLQYPYFLGLCACGSQYQDNGYGGAQGPGHWPQGPPPG